MTAAPLAWEAPHRGSAVPGAVLGVAFIAAASALFALGVATIGFWTLGVVLYVTAFFAAIRWPGYFSVAVLGLLIAFEPGAIDASRPISLALYHGPPGTTQFLPLTISPLEIGAGLAALSILLRRPRVTESRLPLLVWVFPACILLGYLNGARLGAPSNFAYHEMRGFLFAITGFVVAGRLAYQERRLVLPAILAGAGTLSVIVVSRYLFITREGGSPVPVEFSYAHEDVLFLAGGIVIAACRVLAVQRVESRVLLVLYGLLLVVAILVTGRRAGTLVLGVGVLATLFYLIPRRPVLVVCVLVPLMVGGSAYLAVYWNQEYGALAQPARAIRSEFSPSARDEGSNQYRDTERGNVIQTLRLDPVKGVGFGTPFIQFHPLPDLTAWWPLQSHTPHQNILWLWLKMGILGISVGLGIMVLAIARCIERIRITRRLALTPIALIAILLMFATYSTVDLGLTGSRTMLPLGAAIATALALPSAHAARQDD